MNFVNANSTVIVAVIINKYPSISKYPRIKKNWKGNRHTERAKHRPDKFWKVITLWVKAKIAVRVWKSVYFKNGGMSHPGIVRKVRLLSLGSRGIQPNQKPYKMHCIRCLLLGWQSTSILLEWGLWGKGEISGLSFFLHNPHIAISVKCIW